MKKLRFDFKRILLGVSIFSASLLLSACSTPQERRGVSPIPVNAEQHDSYRTFDGGF
jgi:uncharacterized lipoprotein YajG